MFEYKRVESELGINMFLKPLKLKPVGITFINLVRTSMKVQRVSITKIDCLMLFSGK
jgi:hypothetical protein